MSLNYPEDCIPICYRCDNKYLFFLNTSIHSILTSYKGWRKIIFYILTNEVLDLSYINNLKNQFEFDINVINISASFFNENNFNTGLSTILCKKFYGFNVYDDIHVVGSASKANPFCRSKTVASYNMLFLATTPHKKVICMDTDTFIIHDISSLYETNVSDVISAACSDWDSSSTCTNFNPSISVSNTILFKEMFLPKIKDYFNKESLDSKLCNSSPFFEVVQKNACDIVGSRWVELDRSWNVPATHLHLCEKPKIYHFSESWTGRPAIFSLYNELIAKYLTNS